MTIDCVDWDDEDDPAGNVRHIAGAELTTADVEDVLDEPEGPVEDDRHAPAGTERKIVFGWTRTGRHIAVIFEICCDDPFIVRPVTAYDVPEYGEGD
jgi:uncharacterized DUF497 family protein